MNKNYIQGDGNGGLEANVQKQLLKRWGPIAAAGLLVISGFGAKMGEEVWTALAGRSGDLQRIENLEEQVARNREDDLIFRAELSRDLGALRSQLSEINALLRAELEEK